MSKGRRNIDFLTLTARIVSAYVQNNHIPLTGLVDLVGGVDASLKKLEMAAAPAVQHVHNERARRTIYNDYIICLEDGQKFKTLKRHLAARYNLTPDGYRQKWGLADDYPMVAPRYALRRSELARKSRLGARSMPGKRRKITGHD
ncbi:transcriptional regulator, MucR family [Agrobacterium tumefaciens F2]|jgi:predicted transcriptional regulator|nr:transcriptional regulator, MucR family [Agrobacterium tumefaciens F2]